MSKFKISLKGTMTEENNFQMKWKTKMKGDADVITTALAAELISYTMNNGMSKQSFLKQIKEHYEVLEKQYKEEK